MTGVHLPSTSPEVPSTTTGAGFRTPALRSDGRRHAEEALVLPPNHEHQDIDEFPPKGFPKHLDALTEKGGGKRLDTILPGQTFNRTVHDMHEGNGATEHLANFNAMPPGVRIDNTGKKFIQKIAPPSGEHSEGNFVDQSRKNTTGEAVADRLYRILGVPVPRTQIYSLKTGLPVPHDYQWSPGEGATRIAEHLGDKSHEAEKGSDDHKEYLARTGKSWKQHKQKYEMAQALLGGGDDHAGNSMYDGIHHNIPWKVDNGSSLSSNAGGRRKKGWEKIDHRALLLPEVYENFRILSTYHGPNSDAFKNHVHQSYAQLQDIAKIWNRQSGNIEKLFKSEHPEQFEIFKSRAESIVRMLRKIKSPESLHRSFVAHKEHVETNGFAGSTPMKVQEEPRNERGSSLFRSMLMLRAPQSGATHEFDSNEHVGIRRPEKVENKKLLTARIEKAIASLGKAPRKITRRAAMIDTGIKVAGGIAAVAGAANQVQTLAEKNPDKVKQIGTAASSASNTFRNKPIGEMIAPAANWIKDRYNSLTSKAISSAGHKPRKTMLMLTTGKKISNSSNKRSFPNDKKQKLEFLESDKPKSIRRKKSRKGGIVASTSAKAKNSSSSQNNDKKFAALVRRTNGPLKQSKT